MYFIFLKENGDLYIYGQTGNYKISHEHYKDD
jgi:hypothetical protein